MLLLLLLDLTVAAAALAAVVRGCCFRSWCWPRSPLLCPPPFEAEMGVQLHKSECRSPDGVASNNEGGVFGHVQAAHGPQEEQNRARNVRKIAKNDHKIAEIV